MREGKGRLGHVGQDLTREDLPEQPSRLEVGVGDVMAGCKPRPSKGLRGDGVDSPALSTKPT